MSIFHTTLYQPILNVFVGIYNFVPGHDFGLVILVLTLIVRLVLYPLTAASIKAQRSMQEIQPKLEELKKKYADDKQMQAQATMELYKTHKVNPLASCLPMLIQLPILFALFYVLRDAVSGNTLSADLYSFVHDPGKLNTMTMGFFDLAVTKTPFAVVMALLAGGSQYLQAKSLVRKMPPKEAGPGAKDESMTAIMNKQMLYFMPALTAIIGFSFPPGLTLYWFLSTMSMVAQQYWMNKKNPVVAESGKVIEGTIVK